MHPNNSLLFYVALLSIIFTFINAQSIVGVVSTNVYYNAIPANCTSSSCTSSTYFSNYDDNISPTWNNGSRNFLDPIPTGYRAEAINVTLYISVDCDSDSDGSGLVTIEGSIVGFLSGIAPTADCDCLNCLQEINLISPSNPEGWPRYQYGKDNTLKISYDSFISVSNVTISIAYSNPVPEILTYHPSSVPLNTKATMDVYGRDFVNSPPILCSFGGSLTNATYKDSNHLQCPIPTSNAENSTEFQIVDSAHILDGGTFIYYKEPTITGISPESGAPGSNVTLIGTDFWESGSLVCKFGKNLILNVEFIDQNHVKCIAVTDSTTTSREVSVQFSENFNNFITSPTNFTFSNVSPSPSVSISPSKTSTNNGIPKFAWAAVGVAVLILCILLLGVASIVYQNRKKKLAKSDYIYFDEGSTSGSIDMSNRATRTSKDSNGPDPNTIPISELKNLRQIEKGSFGVIYEANWRGTKIAVKKLPATMTDKQLNEFYQEAALMKSLRHPNILQYLGISHAGREVCICMEFMPLGSLYRILHQPTSSFTLQKVKSICLDTARGMNYLHQQQPPIVHRDLKSHNLLVDKHWNIKICDFGLSRITAQNQTMTACGTPSWTAPEVLRNERYTTKADVYGFGIVVWEMFARADPFPGMPPFQIVFAVGTQKLRPRVEPEWPLEWVNLMTSCWNEDPHARPTFESIISIVEGLNEPSSP